LKKLEKRTFYLIIMMIVLVLELLATAVQSTFISSKMCLYPSTNRSCAEEPFSCVDIFDIDTCLAHEEEDDQHCYGMTCDELKFHRQDITSWDTCHTTSNPGGADGIATCEDDGVTRCTGEDICKRVCGFSNSGTCPSCFDYSGLTTPGYDCDDYRTHVLLEAGLENLTDFEECFLDDGVFFKITGCPKASPPTASPTKSSKKKRSIDIGLIVGIVVSVAVLISAIVTVIIVKRSQAIKNEAESEKAKSSIEVARVKHAIQA